MAEEKEIKRLTLPHAQPRSTELNAELVRARLAELRPVLAHAVAGDFSVDVAIPDQEDEFTELFVGVKTMVEVIREQLQELRELNQTLEAKVNERTAALEEAQALTHLGSWQWDVATGMITWSDELYRIFGLKPRERILRFDEYLKLIHPKDREYAQNVIGQALQNGTSFEFIHRIILPNHHERTLHGKGRVIKDKHGNVIKMYGTAQDITKARKDEAELLRSARRFKAVMHATHDLVYDMDLRMRTIWFNEAIHSEYGYSQEYTNTTLAWWIKCIHPDDVGRIEDQTSQLLLGDRQTWETEHRFRKANGSYIVVRNRAYLLRDNQGEPDRIIGSLLDITAQKQLERAKDEFLSLVSHQLRTPLTVTRMFSEMLKDGIAGKLTNQQQEYISRITGASIRMIKLVGDILNISRIELDRIKVEPVPVDVNVLIASHLEELAPIAKEKGVQLNFTPQNDLSAVSIDPDVFDLIVENLLANAIRYTHPGKGIIKVTFTKSKDGLLLQVSDNGIGIPAAARPQIYTRFYRADNAVNFDSEGTGLGLYLIKLVCDTIEAETWFESTSGKGTTFYVLLPPHGMRLKPGATRLE